MSCDCYEGDDFFVIRQAHRRLGGGFAVMRQSRYPTPDGIVQMDAEPATAFRSSTPMRRFVSLRCRCESDERRTCF
jgi:hypothetical protein